ncbi:MAG: hypothetical protein KY393_08700 [Actinobacteria bacterium]|nr:hypothetical protein [Actinomycetota bacterium]
MLAAVTAWAAFAAYSSPTQPAHVATVAEAYELSGLVASPRHANWYWTHSDGWQTEDTVSACSGLSGSFLAECQQIQRARIWALQIDPVTHAVTESRAFSLSNPAWALNPFIAQNNDWEDISVGPVRSDSKTGNLVIAATGDSKHNPMMDSSREDITCNTRRLIELAEPNLADPASTTWTPWKIYDMKSWVGVGGIKSCNVESLVVSSIEADGPTAYLVSKTRGKLLARSLAESTGRDPETPRAAPDSTLAYRPSVTYVGTLREAQGLRITAADSNGADVSLLAPNTAGHPCQILSWKLGSSGLGAILTGASPAKRRITCNRHAEGLAYTRDARDPSVVTKHLMAIADGQSSTSKFFYWYLPDG